MLELNKIYNTTWQNGYKDIEDSSISLIITSPPYNLGGTFHSGNVRYKKAYNTYNDNMPEMEYQEQQVNFLNACYDKLQDDGSMFYNHKPRIRKGVTIHPLEWILKSKFILKQEIIWSSGTPNFDKIRFYPYTERVYWLVKNPKTKIYNELGLSDIWSFKNRKRHPVHNATFPIALPYSIIKSFSNDKLNNCNIVLDPHMGIGTTAKAVIQLNREEGKNINYIGFEIDNTYIQTAEQEINGGYSKRKPSNQISLF